MEARTASIGVPTPVSSREIPKQDEPQSSTSCKVITLIALGIIFIIAGAVSSGCLYHCTQLGNFSFSCLAFVPVGIALIVGGYLNNSSSTASSEIKPNKSTVSDQQPPPTSEPESHESFRYKRNDPPPPEPAPKPGTVEWVKANFPEDERKTAEGKGKLKQLSEEEMGSFGHLFNYEDYKIFSSLQLNWISWEKMIERFNVNNTTYIIREIIFRDVNGENSIDDAEVVVKWRELSERTLAAIWPLIKGEYRLINALTANQIAMLPWEKMEREEIDFLIKYFFKSENPSKNEFRIAAMKDRHNLIVARINELEDASNKHG